jgi:hypothetical protein
MHTFRRLIAAASVSLAVAAPASAATLSVDSQWTLFDFGSTGSAWFDLASGAPLTFSFTLTDAALLKVVDGGLTGDRFEVFNGATALGLTSLPGDAGQASAFDDFDAAFADPRWSRASFLLAPGAYEIRGIATASPLDGGIGGVQLTVVPLPGALALALGGLAFGGLFVRRNAR